MEIVAHQDKNELTGRPDNLYDRLLKRAQSYAQKRELDEQRLKLVSQTASVFEEIKQKIVASDMFIIYQQLVDKMNAEFQAYKEAEQKLKEIQDSKQKGTSAEIQLSEKLVELHHRYNDTVNIWMKMLDKLGMKETLTAQRLDVPNVGSNSIVQSAIDLLGKMSTGREVVKQSPDIVVSSQENDTVDLETAQDELENEILPRSKGRPSPYSNPIDDFWEKS